MMDDIDTDATAKKQRYEIHVDLDRSSSFWYSQLHRLAQPDEFDGKLSCSRSIEKRVNERKKEKTAIKNQTQ